MNYINWDIVRYDAYKLLNNLNQVIEMDLDKEVERLMIHLQDIYGLN